MDGLWDPPCYQATEDTSSFCFPYDVIEEASINEKCCIQVLEILISKQNDDIVEHEEELLDVLCQLACTDEWFSHLFLDCLRAKIDFLESSIRKLKDDDEDFLATSREPAESTYDIPKSLFCLYAQKKDLQFADNTGTTSSSSCQVPADNQKKQIGSSSSGKQLEKSQRLTIIPVETETISLAIVKVEEEDSNYPHISPVPKYYRRSPCWGSTKKTDREVSKFRIKSPIIMKKEVPDLQNRTPRSNSICLKPSLVTHRKQKQQLDVIKSQTYDESMSLVSVPYIESSEEANAMSLATVPYVESSEVANAMSLATLPYVESSEEANVKQINVKEPEFPPGYPNPQHRQKQHISHSCSRFPARTYTRRKKPSSPLQTSSNPPCPAFVVANPLDRAVSYSNLYKEDYYTVNDLRTIAKEHNVRGYSKLRKAELADLLGIKIIEGRRKQPKRRETTCSSDKV